MAGSLPLKNDVQLVTQLPQSRRQVHDVLSTAESVLPISDSEVTCGPTTRPRFGERGFSYCGPAAWNTLPSDLHHITDTSTFRKRLKRVLFDRAYH